LRARPGARRHRAEGTDTHGLQGGPVTGAWAALAILFTVRLAMAFQYQTAAALGPLVMERHGVGIADLGILVAIYLSPGIAVALPGGTIAKQYGDRRIVTLGLLMMVAGGAVMWRSEAWPLQTGGRLMAGTGGVLLNVMMTKMVTDWFAHGRLATAMGIFVNSWPVGIALALLVLPPIAAIGGLVLALGVSAAVTAVGLGLFLTTYRDPPGRAWRLPRVAAGRATCGWSPPCSPARSGASVTARSQWSLPLGRRF
jgi:MFS family permease